MVDPHLALEEQLRSDGYKSKTQLSNIMQKLRDSVFMRCEKGIAKWKAQVVGIR